MRRAAVLGLLPAAALAFAWVLPAHAEKAQGRPVPIKIEFELPQGILKAADPAPLALVVLTHAAGLPPGAAAGGRIGLLLRLPAWVRVASPGWKETPLPPEEKADASGPWKLFEKETALVEPGAPEGLLAREPLALEVTEDGLNWVITARAKLTSPAGEWQAFGTVFATRRGDHLELHAAPRRE